MKQPVRVVFLNRIAWPDEGATALYLTDVAEAVADDGHEVHVVCGDSPYRLPAAARWSKAPVLRRGVRYHRVAGARGHGVADRALASARFLAGAARRLLSIRRPDVIVGMTDPPLTDVLAAFVARRRRAALILWMMDVFPETAVAARLLYRGSPLYRALVALAGAASRRATFVVVLAPAMRRPVLCRGVDRRRVRVIENWAPREVQEAASGPSAERPDRPFTLMYSGAYGRAHDLTPLRDALRLLPSALRIRLIDQVGGGGRMGSLRRDLEGIPFPIEIRTPAPRGRLAATLREGDVHVVSVRDGFERLVAPSKTYAPLRLGLRVLVMAPRAAAPSRLARQHLGSVWLRNDDPRAIAAAIQTLAGLRSAQASPATVGGTPRQWVSLVAQARSSRPGPARDGRPPTDGRLQ